MAGGVHYFVAGLRKATKSCRQRFDEFAARVAREHEQRIQRHLELRAHVLEHWAKIHEQRLGQWTRVHEQQQAEMQRRMWKCWAKHKSGRGKFRGRKFDGARWHGKCHREFANMFHPFMMHPLFYHGGRCFSTQRYMVKKTMWGHNNWSLLLRTPPSGPLSHTPLKLRALVSTFTKDRRSDFQRTERPCWKQLYNNPLFLSKRPTGSELLKTSLVNMHKFSREYSTFASSSFIPSLTTPLHLFYTPAAIPAEPIPNVIASEPESETFVQYDLSPQLSLPQSTELNEEVVSALTGDIDAFADELKKKAADIRRLAQLGSLPVSINHRNGVIKIRFPNSDAQQVETLLDDVEVTRGVVMDHDNVASTSSARSESGSDTSYSYNSDVFGMNSSTEDYQMVSLSSSDMTTPSLTRGTSSASPESSEEMYARLV